METRVAVIGIIVENRESVPTLNRLLSDYGDYIIGRMGVPYHKKGISVISVAIDAPQDIINSLSGSIGNLDGIHAKTAYSGTDFTLFSNPKFFSETRMEYAGA